MDAQLLLPLPRLSRRRPARSANTTANSCATNTFCAAVPAPLRARTFARPIAISFNRKNAGNSRASGWHTIREPCLRRNSVLDLEPASADFLAEVIAGLSASPRTLPCKFFYDERGSELFQKICELPEYYVTRTELQILKNQGRDIAKHLGRGYRIDRPRHGRGHEDAILLDELQRHQLLTSRSIFRRSSCNNRARSFANSFRISKCCRFAPIISSRCFANSENASRHAKLFIFPVRPLEISSRTLRSIFLRRIRRVSRRRRRSSDRRRSSKRSQMFSSVPTTTRRRDRAVQSESC